MFLNVYYDAYKDKIYHRYIDENGKRRVEKVDPVYEYYIYDSSGESPIKDIFGVPVVKKIAKDKKTYKDISKRSKVWESDLPVDMKFLHQRWGHKERKLDISNFQIASIDIECEGKVDFTNLQGAKTPINLITVGLSKQNEYYTFGTREYTGGKVSNYFWIPDEKRLVEKVIEFLRRAKVDVFTGWNINANHNQRSKVNGFDIPYVIYRCVVLGIDYTKLSPYDIVREVKENQFEIAGSSILDYEALYKKFERVKRQNYKLNTIANIELGEGKLDFDGSFSDIFLTDWNKFVEYNVQDVKLIVNLENHPNKGKKYIELALQTCYQSLIPFDRIYSTVQMETGYILDFMHKQNLVINNKLLSSSEDKVPGAYVYMKRGLTNFIMTYDFKSMYPYLILQYGISPENLVMNPDNIDGLSKTPLSETKVWEVADGTVKVGGVYYKKNDNAVIPSVTRKILKEREEFKNKKKISEAMKQGHDVSTIAKSMKLDYDFVKEVHNEILREGFSSKYYDAQQNVRKIYANSLYGILNSKYFHYYNTNNAMAITLGGQELIKHVSEKLNKYVKLSWHVMAHKLVPEYVKVKDIEPVKDDVVILIDTDSNGFTLQEMIKNAGIVFKDNQDFINFCQILEVKYFDTFFNKILDIYAAKYGVENKMVFKREKIGTKFFSNVKKRYLVEVLDNEGVTYSEPQYDNKGIETVRTDTPTFCREYLEKLLIFMLHNSKEDTLKYMKYIKDKFKKAPIEDIAIPKGVSDYDKYALPIDNYLKKGLFYKSKCPIHNKAAINYNYLITKYHLNYETVVNGTAIKFFHINPKNELKQEVVGFIGKFPKEFLDKFQIDYDYMWNRTFQNIIQRYFYVLGWGDVTFKKTDFSKFIK